MSDFIYTIGEPQQRKKTFSASIKDWLRKKIREEKLLNPLGYFLFSGVSLFIALAIGVFGIVPGILFMGIILGLPALHGMVFNTRFGIILILMLEFCLGIVYRLVPGVSFGVLIDVIVCLLIFGMFVQQVGKRDWKFLRNPISVVVLIWIIYNLLQVLNPVATSRLAWVYSVRSIAVVFILFYIALYAINSLSFVTLFMKVMVVFTLIGAVYGCYQEFFGYPQFELTVFTSDPEMFELMFQAGKLRKVSIFADPVVFGVLMSYMSVFCFILCTGPFNVYKKVFLGITAFLCMFSMSFSGTRTAYVLLPISFVFYVLLSHQKKMLIAMGVFAVFGAVLILMPTSNSTIVRVQSAFRPGKDASFQVRVKNQQLIKPYIQSHPFGSGLGCVGLFGKKFSPGTFLSKFPPDSGYVRIAIEQGWIGLILYFILLFVVLKEGIKYYYRCVDPRIKTYYAALVTMIYTLTIGSYPQEIFTSFPIPVVFCTAMALICKLKDFDPTFAKT